MRTIFMAFVAIISLALATPAGSADTGVDVTAIAAGYTWQSQSGSIMSLTFDPTSTPDVYQLSGYYINNKPGYSCQGTPYPVTGYFLAPTATISFSVAWKNNAENCLSVTGWTGYMNAQTLVITTNWNLAYEASPGVMRIDSGADVFQPVQTGAKPNLTSQ